MSDWPHAPVHCLGEAGAYIVTAGTYHKEKLFNTPERLQLLLHMLLPVAKEFGWNLQAWAVLANHYHFVGLSPDDASSLTPMLSKLHTLTAREINRMDGIIGRHVWFQFWDTKITYQRSYLARLKYVHYNPLHHGVVKVASQYPWCSASWFERVAEPAFQKVVKSFKTDQLNVYDDFGVQACSSATVFWGAVA